MSQVWFLASPSFHQIEQVAQKLSLSHFMLWFVFECILPHSFASIWQVLPILVIVTVLQKSMTSSF